MPHQPHKDIKGEPDPTRDDIRFHESQQGQASGSANRGGQTAYNQQGAAGNIDQRGEPARKNLYPETRKRETMAEPTARDEGNLRQTRVYDDE